MHVNLATVRLNYEVKTYQWPWRSHSHSWKSLLTSPWTANCCHLHKTEHPLKIKQLEWGRQLWLHKETLSGWSRCEAMYTWKSTALLLARSALFPDSAMTMFGLACLWSSLTQFFALANDSFKVKNANGAKKKKHQRDKEVWQDDKAGHKTTIHSWREQQIDSLHWWCHKLQWQLGPLCNTWGPNCGNAPVRLCPKSQTLPLCHPSTPSALERPLEAKVRSC